MATSDFLDMASTTVAHYALSTVSVYGANTYSTSPTTYPAHVEHMQQMITDATGRQVVASAVVYVLSSSASISVNDLVTLPNSSNPKMLRADPVNDETGLHHYELYF